MRVSRADSLPNWAIHAGGGPEVSCVRFWEAMLEKHAALFARPMRALSPRVENPHERRAMTASELADMVRRFRSGESKTEIAKALNRSRVTIDQHLRRMGLRSKPGTGRVA